MQTRSAAIVRETGRFPGPAGVDGVCVLHGRILVQAAGGCWVAAWMELPGERHGRTRRGGCLGVGLGRAKTSCC